MCIRDRIDTTANVKLNYWIVKHLSAENLFNDSYKVVISYKLFDGRLFRVVGLWFRYHLPLEGRHHQHTTVAALVVAGGES